MRKTPCPEHRKSMLSATYYICAGCGEWNIVNGKAVR
jgi:gentisate 1,2-dioxygenase